MNKYLLWIIVPSVFFICLQYHFFGNRLEKKRRVYSGKNEFTVGFYNLENLFDTINDPKINDEEFLPASANLWGTERYVTKLNHMAEVISAMNTPQGIDILGVCEIENVQVLTDLVNHKKLKDYHYRIVHFDSPDARGIDVALFYNKTKFTFLKASPVKVNYDEKDFATRDILWTTLLMGTDTLHVFVNHWPSRRGGTEQSEPKRIAAATALNNELQRIGSNPNSRVVIMGDFNDEPTDKSLTTIFKTYDVPQPNCNTCLINPMIALKEQKLGSHFYRGHYSMLDQILFTQNLSRPEFYDRDYRAVRIVKEDFMLKVDSATSVKRPSRTFEGQRYNGGYSDHLPVYTSLIMN